LDASTFVKQCPEVKCTLFLFIHILLSTHAVFFNNDDLESALHRTLFILADFTTNKLISTFSWFFSDDGLSVGDAV